MKALHETYEKLGLGRGVPVSDKSRGYGLPECNKTHGFGRHGMQDLGERMLGRREVLVGGGGGLAALSFGPFWHAAEAAATPVLPAPTPALFLVDTMLPGATGAIGVGEQAGIPLVRFAGDVGSAWLSHLEPLWRTHRAPVAGVTYGGAFFCVERLARTSGLACTFRSSPLSVGQSGLAVAAGNLLIEAARPGAECRAFGAKAAGEADDRALVWLLRPLAKG